MTNNKDFETLSLKDVVLTLQGILEQERNDLPVVFYFNKQKGGEGIWSVEYCKTLGEVQFFGERYFEDAD